jgi:LmbE family N-acetylglucosaminyl deacetylase
MVDPLRLLAVFPHPDDESLGMGPTLAKYSAEGVETYLLTATRGERGWNGPEEEDPGMQALGEIREKELHCAADQLGLKEVSLLDLIDGDVDRADPASVIRTIAYHLRRVRPQVVVTFSMEGNYGHPDHIALAQFTAGALLLAADAGFEDHAHFVPHRVSKFYHIVDSAQMVKRVRDAIGGIRMEVDGVERNHVGWEEWAVTTRIDARVYFDTAWKAILCHRSQLAGYGPLVDLPRDTLISIWGEGTFVRVFSLVNGGRQVETDLFEGVS